MQSCLLAFVMGLVAASPRPVTSPAEAPTSVELPVGSIAVTAPPVDGALANIPDVHTITLANGLTVILSENHAQPQIYGAVAVHVGSKDDPADNTGLAHYLEHMLFKGTTELGTTNWAAEEPLQHEIEGLYEQLRTASPSQQDAVQEKIRATVAKTYAYAVPNELDQALEQFGGLSVNAFTTSDMTVYHNVLPSSQVIPWLKIYAHRFTHPVFRLFPSELEAVYEEKNRALDTLGYEAYRSFMRRAFPGHPYGSNDTLGEVEHLKRPSILALRTHFDRYYVPGNMALILVGDFDSEGILPEIEAEFGKWPARPVPGHESPSVAPFSTDERLTVRLTPIRLGAIAYRTVAPAHPDYAALVVARLLLANEQRTGYLDRLADDGKLLAAIDVPADFAQHNLDTIVYVPRLLTQTFRGAERLVTDQVGRIAAGDFSEKTFEALRANLLKQEALGLEDNTGRGEALAEVFVAYGSWARYVKYLQRLQRLTKQEVQQVAARLFESRRLLARSRVGFSHPERLVKPNIPTVEAREGQHSSFYKQLLAVPAQAPNIQAIDFAETIDTATFGDEIAVHANSNPLNDYYRLEVRFGVGSDHIRDLRLLAPYVQRIGTAEHSAQEFHEHLFALSSTITGHVELDRFVVTLEGPERHRIAAQALLAELLGAAAPSHTALRQLRRELWIERRVERKELATVAIALREKVLYGKKSAYMQAYGPRSGRMVSAKRLIDVWHQVQQFRPEIRYVGRASATDVAASLDETLAAGSGLGRIRKSARPHVVYRRQAPDETTVYFVPHRNAVQTQIWLAVEGDPIPDADRAAADAFSQYFGGSMAGLVFQEVREFRALAYSAFATYLRDEQPDQRGYLIGSLGCQADKTAEALGVMIGLIQHMPDRADRLGPVRQALVRAQEADSPGFRELQDKIQAWRYMGYAQDPRPQLQKAYEQLSYADVRRFYDKYIAGRPIAIMVVGSPREIDQAMLRKFGRVVRLRGASLFSP